MLKFILLIGTLVLIFGISGVIKLTGFLLACIGLFVVWASVYSYMNEKNSYGNNDKFNFESEKVNNFENNNIQSGNRNVILNNLLSKYSNYDGKYLFVTSEKNGITYWLDTTSTEVIPECSGSGVRTAEALFKFELLDLARKNFVKETGNFAFNKVKYLLVVFSFVAEGKKNVTVSYAKLSSVCFDFNDRIVREIPIYSNNPDYYKDYKKIYEGTLESRLYDAVDFVIFKSQLK